MTIASEIERLQEAKSDIKASIEWKWVSVPNNIKLDAYDTYIDQIKSGVIAEMFTPASLTYDRVLYNSYNGMAWRPRAIAYEWLDPANTAYYSYFFAMVDDSSSWVRWNPNIVVLRKACGDNWTTTLYVWPQYSNNSTYDYPEVYDTFALNENGTLKVYIIYHVDQYSNNNYIWETVWIWDITSGCTVLDSAYISNTPTREQEINAKREEFKQSVWYYTYPVLSNGWVTSMPSIDWDHSWYKFTYTLNFNN